MTNSNRFNIFFMSVVIAVLLAMSAGVSSHFFEVVKFFTLWGYGALLVLATILVPFMLFAMLATKHLNKVAQLEGERIHEVYRKIISGKSSIYRTITVGLSIILAILAFREGLILLAILEVVSEIANIIFYSLKVPEPQGEEL